MMQRVTAISLLAIWVVVPWLKESQGLAQSRSVVQIAQGAQLKLILKTHLSTRTSRAGDPFSAELAEPVMVGGKLVLPGTVDPANHRPPAIVSGVVASAEPAKRLSQLRGKASMVLRFERIRWGTWQQDLAATLVSLHDPINPKQRVGTTSEGEVHAKEDVNGDLKKVGIGAAGGSLLGLIFGNVSRGLLVGMLGGGAAVLAAKGKNVEMQPGTGIVIRLDRPLDVPLSAESHPSGPSVEKLDN